MELKCLQVIQLILREASGLSQDSDAFRTLLSSIMAEIRVIILQTVQAWRAEQAAAAKAAADAAAAAAAAAAASQSSSSAVTSIFGTGGANNIKVKTQDFQFNTAWE